MLFASIGLQIVYLMLLAFLYILFGRGSAAALEVVWSVTDPPLKALRRVIPPLRLGNVSFDLASLVLLVIVLLLKLLVLPNLIAATSA